MTQNWPAFCTAAALVVLLILIIRYRLHAFVALLVVSIGLGLAAGMPPERVVGSIGRGVGDILASVAILLALGAVLGRLLDVSGAAEVIARTLVDALGEKRASLAVLAAAYLVGIPVLFNVGFLLLIPIMWRLQRDTGRSLLYFALPLAFGLAIPHSLIPPHPGIVGAVSTLAPKGEAGRVMVETIVFGTLMGIPLVLLGWLGPGRWWAARQFVPVPEHLAAKNEDRGSRIEDRRSSGPPPSAILDPRSSILVAEPTPFPVALLIVTLPLVLSLAGFGVDLLHRLGRLPPWATAPLFGVSHTPLDWLKFLGHPTIALLVPTALAFLLVAVRQRVGRDRLAKLTGDALADVGTIALLFGAAGGFAQVIKDCGAGEVIAEQARQLPLSPVAICYLVAALVRIALGSATASIALAASLLSAFVQGHPGQETLLVLAVANGVTFMTQPADSGFWMVKEYCNLSVRDVLLRFNACRITMSLVGLLLLLAYEAWRR